MALGWKDCGSEAKCFVITSRSSFVALLSFVFALFLSRVRARCCCFLVVFVGDRSFNDIIYIDKMNDDEEVASYIAPQYFFLLFL